MFETEISRLAALRQEQEALKKVRHALVQAFEDQPEYRSLVEQEEANSAALIELDKGLREAAVASGELNPHPAITVKTYTALEYSEGEMIGWCTRNMTPALSLNRRVFEKIAHTGAVPGVVIKDERKATIATDLSKWLVVEEAKP